MKKNWSSPQSGVGDDDIDEIITRQLRGQRPYNDLGPCALIKGSGWLTGNYGGRKKTKSSVKPKS